MLGKANRTLDLRCPRLRLWRLGRTGLLSKEGASMKAIVQDTYGSTGVLEFRDVDKPEIADDDVRPSPERQVGHADARWCVAGSS